MASPTKFYPVGNRPYQHQPHIRAVATMEAKRQPNTKRRSRAMRALRSLKASMQLSSLSEGRVA